MEFLNKKQKVVLAMLGCIMLIFIGYYILNKTESPKYIDFDNDVLIDTEEKTSKNEEKNEIIVHITGEVENEGIVKIEENSRISDVIEQAGGITEDADLSKINLAYEVKDGQKIYIPNTEENLEDNYITEDAGEGVVPEESKIGKTEKVNINTAKQTELETLNGIGPSTALKIINYRNENGKFKSIEDIKNVTGIGESKYENIKDDICV